MNCTVHGELYGVGIISQCKKKSGGGSDAWLAVLEDELEGKQKQNFIVTETS